jgi:hypothetical protein
MEVEGFVMNADVKPRFAHVLTKAEQEVLNALRDLPSGFVVQMQPERLNFEKNGVPYTYEPDFVVTGPDGRRLIVEVKSPHSLSLSNMASLSAISQHAEKAGEEFLVVVPNSPLPQPLNQMMKDFDNLKISFSSDSSGVQRAVVEALERSSGD